MPQRGGLLQIKVYDHDGIDKDDLLGQCQLRVGGDDGLGGRDVLSGRKPKKDKGYKGSSANEKEPDNLALALDPQGTVTVRVEHLIAKRRLWVAIAPDVEVIPTPRVSLAH